MSNQVIINDAVKYYGNYQALKGVSLNINEGEFFTLLGPSGCGKTTLLRMIAGFNSIEGGDFFLPSIPQIGFSIYRKQASSANILIPHSGTAF